jgi:hypothetical protein
MSDEGYQPNSPACMRACATLEIHQAFSSYNHLGGSANAERFMRTLREKGLWLQERIGPSALVSPLKAWTDDYP